MTGEKVVTRSVLANGEVLEVTVNRGGYTPVEMSQVFGFREALSSVNSFLTSREGYVAPVLPESVDGMNDVLDNIYLLASDKKDPRNYLASLAIGILTDQLAGLDSGDPSPTPEQQDEWLRSEPEELLTVDSL